MVALLSIAPSLRLGVMLQQLLGMLHHILRQEPERLLQILVRRRGPEAVDAVHGAVEADVLSPAEGGGGFDGEAFAELVGEDGLLVVGGLLVEELEAGKADDAGAGSLGGELLGGF